MSSYSTKINKGRNPSNTSFNRGKKENRKMRGMISSVFLNLRIVEWRIALDSFHWFFENSVFPGISL
jgi:hypothetical protein